MRHARTAIQSLPTVADQVMRMILPVLPWRDKKGEQGNGQ